MDEFTTDELKLIDWLVKVSDIPYGNNEEAESISAKILYELDSRKADMWDEFDEL